MPAGKRIIAKFIPEAWVNDWAVRVDPRGPDTFDVTDQIIAMGKEKALALRDDQYETDDLCYVPGAPQWIKDWEGPFYVAVAEAIAEYFEEE